MIINQKMFEDILRDRRQELSNWLWFTRALETKIAIEIKPKPSPDSHKESVVQSPKVKELIEELNKIEKVSKKDLEKRIRLILDEIGFNKNLNIIRLLGYTLLKICLNVCSGIYVNYEGILEVKSKMGRCPIIFVPSHRSYADFIIFSYVCFHYDIEIPSIAAGMDFHGMMGMGEVLRNTGAFFMRRSYNNDNTYWIVFKEYVNQIVAKGDLPIEFFIEGTRSRSNKTISPKYGLINMILKALFLSQVTDILFVPVSVNYDRILEENLFAFELLGIPKPKESTSAFFKSLKIIKEKFGNIYLHFGKPISSREFFGDELHRTSHSFGPIHLHEITEQEKRIISPLAHEIVRKQQQNNILSYFNIIALTLNNTLSRGHQFMHMADLMAEIKILKKILQSWGAAIFDQDIEETVKESLVIHKNLIVFQDNETIHLVTNRITMEKLNPKKLKAHALSEDTITYSVPFVMLQIYTNPVLHYLIDPALIISILKTYGGLKKDELFKHYCTMRSIFFFEFLLLESCYQMQFEKTLMQLTNEKIILFRSSEYDILVNRYLEEVLMTSIQTFILIYYVMTDVLQKGPESIDEKIALVNVQKLLEDIINKRQVFIHPYCMTLDSLTNCINSFNRMNILKKNRRDGKNVYQVNTQEITKVKEKLESFIPSFHGIKDFLHKRSKI